jgi:hypothetical protein
MQFCEIKEIQLRSGRDKLATFTPIQESGAVFQRPEVDRSGFVLDKSMFDFRPLRSPVQVDQGLGITVKVFFDSHDNVQLPDGSFTERRLDRGVIEFFSVGVDWEMV